MYEDVRRKLKDRRAEHAQTVKNIKSENGEITNNSSSTQTSFTDVFQMVGKQRYQDRESGIHSFDFQPSKLKTLLETNFDFNSNTINLNQTARPGKISLFTSIRARPVQGALASTFCAIYFCISTPRIASSLLNKL